MISFLMGIILRNTIALKKTLKSRVDFLFLILVVLSGVISFMESFNILLNYGVSKWHYHDVCG